jgi:hypothetical protein
MCEREREANTIQLHFISLLSLFWKNKCRLVRPRCSVSVCICMCIPSINLLMAKPIFMNLGMYVKAPEPIWTA